MPKKPRKYKPGRYQYLVSSTEPIIRIDLVDDYKIRRLMRGPDKKPTLHAKGGLIKGKPKLAKKGWR
jgi:hypothetical protein